MDTIEADIIIVGGGLTGSTLAILLARHEWDVVLIEKDRFPRDKLCGEFLSPEAQELLSHLNCLDILKQQEHRLINYALFSTSYGQEMRFKLPGNGLGIKRMVLDQTLFNQAKAENVNTFEGLKVESIHQNGQEIFAQTQSIQFKAPVAIAAYGRRNHLDKKLNRPFLNKISPLTGFKRHMKVHSNVLLDDKVEIHTFAGGYCGMCMVDDNTANVCMLINDSILKSFKPINWETLKEFLGSKNRVLKNRLELIEEIDSPLLSVGQVSFVKKEFGDKRLLYAGDAAGMISPLCGDGQAMAIAAGFELSETLHTWRESKSSIEKLQSDWLYRWQKCFKKPIRLGWWLQKMFLNRAGAEFLVGAGRLFPLAASYLTKATRSKKG